MNMLLKTASKRELDTRKFLAGLQGIDFDKALKEQADVDERGVPKKFKEPGHYDHLPMKQRKKITEEMKKKFMGIAQATPMRGK